MKILKDGKEMFTGEKILFTVEKKIFGYCEGKSVHTCPNCLTIVKSNREMKPEVMNHEA